MARGRNIGSTGYSVVMVHGLTLDQARGFMGQQIGTGGTTAGLGGRANRTARGGAQATPKKRQRKTNKAPRQTS
jgi:hypothetical protein